MPARRLVVTTLTAAVCFLLTSLEALQAQSSRLSKRLEEGDRVNLNVRNLAVSKVLERIENSTGNRIRFVDRFGRDDEKVLRSKVSLDLDRATFWEAVSQLETATGYQFKSLGGGVLELTQDPFKFGHAEPAGAPIVEGCFLVIPEVETFFKRAQIRIRPEPWIEGARVTDYHVALTLDNGDTLTFRPRSRSPNRTVNGDIELPVEPELPKGVKSARKLELEATVEIPRNLEKMTTPPLGKLLPRTSRHGAVEVRIVEFALDESSAGKEERRLNVRFEVEGSELPNNSARLVGPGGETVEPRIWSSSGLDERQEIRTSYYSPEFADKLERWNLVFEIPVLETRKLGKIGDLEEKPKPAGLAKIQVDKARISGKLLTLEVTITGAEIDPDSIVVVEDGKEVEPSGHFSSTIRKKQTAHITYELSEGRSSAASLELIARVPVEKQALEIEKPAKLVGEPAALGVAEVRVLDASDHRDEGGDEFLRVRLEIRGASLDVEEMHLLDPKGKLVQRAMWSTSGLSDLQQVTLDFDPDTVGKSVERCRLRLAVPENVVPYTLRATLKNIELKP